MVPQLCVERFTAARWECGDEAGVTIANKENLFGDVVASVKMSPDEMIELAADLMGTAMRIKRHEKEST